MTKKNIYILIFSALAVLIIALAGYLIYYFFVQKPSQALDLSTEMEAKYQDAKKKQEEAMRLAYNAEFPDLISGVVNIISDKKTTIKSGGKEYLISPARPMAFFKDSGINNGDSVEVRGKIISNGVLSLGSIIKKD